ncbi:MAG: hypothetical protein AB8B63_23655 [Granulosicoccus sp.]
MAGKITMKTAMEPLKVAWQRHWPALLGLGVAFAVVGQVIQLILLILRFGDLPNYIIHYDWVASVGTIVQSTPSLKDAIFIAFEEWWIEIGFMNYDYGNGLSEWSLNVIPSRLVMMSVLGTLLATLWVLRKNTHCKNPRSHFTLAGASLGTLLMYGTSAAMSWVVCCATPSWVVGLAMLGLNVSLSLALEDLGPTLFYSGFALLAASVLLASRQQAVREQTALPAKLNNQETGSTHDLAYHYPRSGA